MILRLLVLPAIFIAVVYILVAKEPAVVRADGPHHALTAERIEAAEAISKSPWKNGE